MRSFSYAWYVVAAAAVTYMITIGVTFSAFGVYVVPVSAEFGLSRADMNTAMILVNVGMGVTAPLVGRALDRFSPKLIMMGSSLAFGACLVALAYSRSLLLDALLLALPLAIAFQAAGGTSMGVFVARWFASNRGRPMALAVSGMSFGSILVVPGVGLLIEAYGWRTAMAITGVAAGGLLFLISLTMRDRPEAAAAAAGPEAVPSQPPRPVGELLRMRLFWLIAVAASLTFAVSTALGISLVPLALLKQLTLLQATSLISAAGIAGLAGKFILVAIGERVSRALLLTGIFGLTGLLNFALMAADGYGALLACAIAQGLITGAVMPAYMALVADRFGAASFGTVGGLITPVTAAFSLVAVRGAGEVYDRTGGYDVLFASFIAVQLLAALLIFATRHLRQPAFAAQPLANPS